MSEKKVSSGGSFGGKVDKSKVASAPRPAPARSLAEEKKRELEAKRAAVRAKQEAWKAKKTLAPTKPAVKAADEALVSRLNSCQSTFNDLQDDIMLTSVHDDMGKVEAVLVTLGTDLEQCRAQGYTFRSYLENKIDVLTDKWENVCDTVEPDIEKQGDAMAKEADEAHTFLQHALAGNSSMLARAESSVRTLESKANATRGSLQGRYSDVAQTIHQTRQQIDQIRWSLEQASEAKVDFLQGEYLVSACKARILAKPDDKDGPEGVLYLTDERLIFEQKEQVATKKILFITTASEMVQETRLAEPLGHIERVEAQDTRHFLSTKELFTVHFTSQARQATTIIELLDGATNEEWVQQLNRAKSGEIERERIATAATEKKATTAQVAQAPTICSTCGGTLDATIARGQQTITCEYCGAVTRLG